jgi:membrane-bound lytic murein transglycosylase D
MTSSQLRIGFLVLLIAAVSGIFMALRDDDSTSTEKTYRAYFSRDYNVYALDLPDAPNLAGEPVPLGDFEVAERLDRELLVNTYWQSNGLLLIKRAAKYFPIIEPILAEEGIPNDFKYLALAESGMQHIVSPAGAAGIWQIMKGTGQEYGLEVRDDVDERYHIEKATHVACAYLREAYSKFGSWTLAAASYNMGMNGLERRLESQGVSNYYDLLLNSETSRYVFRIIALKELLSHPEGYGFHYDDRHLYNLPETRGYRVDTSIADLAVWAQSLGSNYKMLKTLNPWLRSNELKLRTDEAYTLQLPAPK